MMLVTKIYRELKKQNGLSLDEIRERTREPIGDIETALREQIDKGFILFDEVPKTYRIRFVLESYTKRTAKVTPPAKTARKYEDILAKKLQLGGHITTTASPTPTTFMNAFLKHVVHQGQGNTGTCVGQTIAYAANLNYVQLTGDLPTAEDWVHVKFNVRYDPNNPNSTTYYDILLPKSFAMAFSYWKSREKCGITEPSGSYVSCAVASWRDDGMCLNDQWYLSKDGRTAWREPYPDVHPITKETAKQTAVKHKIEGYASLNSAVAIREAIAKYGFVVGAIECYENMGSIDPKTGIFPDPKGQAIGGHALCFVGYDANYLYCLHSWRDELPAKIGGISWSYYNVGAIEFFTVLDSTENTIIIEPPQPVPPVANFTATPTTGPAPLTVQFVDKSTGQVDGRTWNFGDGTPLGTGATVSHTYQAAGIYQATLTASNSGGAMTVRQTITVTEPVEPAPVAVIEATPSSGTAPLTVQFYDRTKETVVIRSWTFGDGTPASTLIAPKHIYNTPGDYIATLTVSNGSGSDSSLKTISVGEAPPPPPIWQRIIDFIRWILGRMGQK